MFFIIVLYIAFKLDLHHSTQESLGHLLNPGKLIGWRVAFQACWNYTFTEASNLRLWASKLMTMGNFMLCKDTKFEQNMR